MTGRAIERDLDVLESAAVGERDDEGSEDKVDSQGGRAEADEADRRLVRPAGSELQSCPLLLAS